MIDIDTDTICEICNTPVTKKSSDILNHRTGRPWKHKFCSRLCYNRWRANRHNEIKQDWLKFQRDVWGTIPLGQFEVCHARGYGRKAEFLARDVYLPAEGFTEISDMSGLSNQFYIDFIATYNGQRVLVDATVKLKAYIPEKILLARALRMPLYMIHVSVVRRGALLPSQGRGNS